jgi:hypothetical protein
VQKTIKLLVILLGAQLLLALGLGLTGQELSAGLKVEPLITVDQDRIDRITVEGTDQSKVVLTRQGDVWQLPEAADFPADQGRISQLLDQIDSLKTGTPVATSSGAQERFKVSSKSFERRITLAQGDESLATLYLGNSPGIRRVHARVDGSKSIHSVKMAAYEVPVKSAGWEDKTILQLPQAEILAIELNGLRLERTTPVNPTTSEESVPNQADAKSAPSGWTLKSTNEAHDLTAGAADKLAGLLASLRFDRVLGQEPMVDYGLGKPLLEVTLTRKGSDALIYRLGKSADREEYTLKASSRPEFFRLANYTATALIAATKLDQLLAEPSADSKAGDVTLQSE